MKRALAATLAAGLWINLSEFLRNELLFKRFWVEHYDAMGLMFPSEPVNGALWGVWGFGLAACIVSMSRKLTAAETFAVGWAMAFALMWIVIWNLGVLPVGLLVIAAPWSLAEVAGAVWLARRITGGRTAPTA